MIKIKKPEKPPREGDFKNNTMAFNRLKRFIERLRSNKNTTTIYSWARSELLTIYHEKCAYCESKYPDRKNASLEVEHFRPINQYPCISKTPFHDGYPWLMAEWTNLVLACGACNKPKSSKFEISGVRVDAAPDPFDSAALDLLKADNKQYLDEKPKLIHPELEDPELFFDYNSKGELFEKPGLSPDDKVRATYTLETLCLRNDSNRLNMLKNELISPLRTSLKHYHHERLTGSHANLESEFFECFQSFHNVDPTLEYCGFRKWICANFRTVLQDHFKAVGSKTVIQFYDAWLKKPKP